MTAPRLSIRPDALVMNTRNAGGIGLGILAAVAAAVIAFGNYCHAEDRGSRAEAYALPSVEFQWTILSGGLDMIFRF